MPFVKVANVSDLPEQSLIEVSVGENLYALCNVAGTIHALSGVCLHQEGPLGQGNLLDGRVICPWHAWEFDCRTGDCIEDPTRRLAKYEVKVDGGDILLQVP